MFRSFCSNTKRRHCKEKYWGGRVSHIISTNGTYTQVSKNCPNQSCQDDSLYCPRLSTVRSSCSKPDRGRGKIVLCLGSRLITTLSTGPKHSGVTSKGLWSRGRQQTKESFSLCKRRVLGHFLYVPVVMKSIQCLPVFINYFRLLDIVNYFSLIDPSISNSVTKSPFRLLFFLSPSTHRKLFGQVD